MEPNLFNDDDLKDLFEELNETEEKEENPEDKEMDASQRRYMEIIKKHKEEK